MSNGVDMSNCPAQQGYLPDTTAGCHCYYINQQKGIVDVSAATPYNTTYYAMDKDNCCNGYTESKPGFPKGFPINQRGRWNWNTTNTKMYRPNGLLVTNRIPQGCTSNLYLYLSRPCRSDRSASKQKYVSKYS